MLDLRKEIKDILDDVLVAQERTFLGEPAMPIVTGKDVVTFEIIKKLVDLKLIDKSLLPDESIIKDDRWD